MPKITECICSSKGRGKDVYSSTIHLARNIQMSTRGRIGKYLYSRILYSNGNEQTTATHNMNDSHTHEAEQK